MLKTDRHTACKTWSKELSRGKHLSQQDLSWPRQKWDAQRQCKRVVSEQRGYLLGKLFLGVGAELQQAHQHSGDVHVGLPDGEAAADEVDGGPADGAVRGQLGAGRLQQQERQRLACVQRATDPPSGGQTPPTHLNAEPGSAQQGNVTNNFI